MRKTAVVGVGYLGRFHAQKYAQSKNAELVAVVDLDRERGEAVAAEVGAEYVADYRRLPELGVTAASVASVTSSHFEVASWLLAHGIDVLVEKPITVTVAEAEELIKTARSNGRILQVGHLERFNPAFRAMKEVLTAPLFFEVRRIAQFKGRGHDVDVVRDLMIHDIDIVSHLVGRPVKSVEAVGVPVLTDKVDIANARISFEGGAVANFTASRAAFKTERSIRVFQPDVYISLDFGAKRLKIYQKKAGEGVTPDIPAIDFRELPVEERDALEHEIEAFIEASATGTSPEVTGEDGLRALRLAEQITESMRINLNEAGLLLQTESAAPSAGAV
ncbi:MAG: Gfo/Idh/MocA family oxidoreductase [bacterium]|nr:Gfo/Idh/MocA family oxidoreductase [bacterium]